MWSIKKRITTYYAETKQEVKKATWPGREELTESTLIVIIATLALTAFIFVADQILAFGVEKLIEISGGGPM